MKSNLTINSVVKAFRLLECFREEKSTYTLTELTRELHITTGTAQRITHTLTSLGYLQRDPQTKAFQLTSKWLSFGYAFMKNLNLREIVQPHLKELNRETNETVNLAVMDGDEITYVERYQTSHFITTNIRAGARRPAFCSSIGKAILAFMEPARRKDYFERVSFKKYTPKTIITRKELREELQKIKNQGYAENNSELSDELFAIAVPLLNEKGYAVGGINIVIPRTRISDEKIKKEFIPSLLEKGRKISSELGYVV